MNEIHFTTSPVRVVSGTDDPMSYLDERGSLQGATYKTELRDSGISGIVHHDWTLSETDARAVRTVLSCVAFARLQERDAVQAKCEQAACVIVNRYHPGQAEASLGREIVRAIREAGKR